MTSATPISIPNSMRVLTVPGLYGSGPAHWQTRWEQLHPDWLRVVQRDWSLPSLYGWAERIGEVVNENPQPAQHADQADVLLVAHSFGCLASLHYALEEPERIAGMLLVAPANPDKFGVAPLLPRAALPFPTIVAASQNDPWMPQPVAFGWASRWGSERIDLGAVGHVNAESDLGDWTTGLALLEHLMQRIDSKTAHAHEHSRELLPWQRAADWLGPIPYM
jgi:predicted alpha/beta hydrolase family esterase